MTTPVKPRDFWLVKYRKLSLDHSVYYLPPIEPNAHFEVKHVIEKSAYQKAVDALKESCLCAYQDPCPACKALKELGESK